jgi:uncharacterized membrane-anchored protein YhcB (DUF1043 family)
MWFQTLESKQSKWALTVVIAAIVLNIILRSKFPSILNISYPVLGLFVGVSVGWVMGELFVNVSAIGKVIWGTVSALFLASVTLDQFKQKVGPVREKVLYLFSLVPISDPKKIDMVVYFTVGFALAFVISIGIIATRKKEASDARQETLETERNTARAERDALQQQLQQSQAKAAGGQTR